MKKNILISVLVVIIIILSVIVWKNQSHTTENVVGNFQNTQEVKTADPDMSAPDGGSVTNYDYFLIPEFKLRFTKIPGLTLNYTVNGKSVNFSSKEIQEVAKNDPGVAYCVSDFPHIQISTTPISQTEYKGYRQKSLGGGQYMNIYAPQSVCYTEKTTQADKDLVMHQLNDLFNQFIDSAQLYSY